MESAFFTARDLAMDFAIACETERAGFFFLRDEDIASLTAGDDVYEAELDDSE